MLVESQIREKLQVAFKPLHLELVNESRRHHRPAGSETHFKLLMVSETFDGIARLRRQQEVHAVLAEELRSPVHALTMKLLSPEEWRQLPDSEKRFHAIGHHPSGKIEE